MNKYCKELKRVTLELKELKHASRELEELELSVFVFIKELETEVPYHIIYSLMPEKIKLIYDNMDEGTKEDFINDMCGGEE